MPEYITPFLGLMEGKPKLDKYLVRKNLNIDSPGECGVYQGSLSIVRGDPGTGTELFGFKFASECPEHGAYYFTTKIPENFIKASLETFKLWHTLIEIKDIYSKKAKDIEKEYETLERKFESLSVTDLVSMENKDEEEDRLKKAGYLYEVVSIIKDSPEKRVVIDSLDFFLNEYGESNVLKYLNMIKQEAYKSKETILVLMAKYPENPVLIRNIDDIADVVIELEKKEVASTIENRIYVRKVAGFPPVSDILTYTTREGKIGIDLVSRVM